jgi:hypothetical protein
MGGSRAFSSEVGTGSREENATRIKRGAFSSEVGTGSREENAKKERESIFKRSMPLRRRGWEPVRVKKMQPR